MKVERISYSESRESSSHVGLKSWKKYSVDIVLEEGDDKEQVSSDAKKMVVKWLNGGIEVNPEYAAMYNERLELVNEKIPEKNIQHEQTEIDIDNAKSVLDLESVWPKCIDSTREIIDQYASKWIELSPDLEQLGKIKNRCQNPTVMKQYMSRLKELTNGKG